MQAKILYIPIAAILTLTACGNLGFGDAFDYEKIKDEFTSEEISKATASLPSDSDKNATMQIVLQCSKPLDQKADPFRSTKISFILNDQTGDPLDFSDLVIKFDGARPPQDGFLKNQNISKYSNVSEQWYSKMSALMLETGEDRVAALAYLQGGGLIGASLSAALGGSVKTPEQISHDLIEAALSAEVLMIRYETSGGTITTATVNIDGGNYRKVLEDCGWNAWLEEWDRNHSASAAPNSAAANTAPAVSLAEASNEEVVAPTTSKIQPSFDCSEASSKTERMICSSSTLAQLDVELSEAYRTARADGMPLPEDELRRTQKEWISGNNQCSDVPCLEQRYLDRISFLTEFDFN